ncbi:invasion associated locus B family protein [Bradyrhizobium sp.]|uniref:invasion associated locus B family protein n=1 Tax=Bradyrhizobium sp. TaxID=376 RepID=UPI0039E249F7
MKNVVFEGLRRWIVPALLLAGALAPASALAQTAPTLPGGASSLQEAFQDWRVACRVAETTKVCVLAQQQAQQNGQRVVAVELQPRPDNTVTGTMVLPFGLLLSAGATLQIDEQKPLAPLAFNTCVPGGCVINIVFDAATVTALRSGKALKVAAKTADNQRDFPLTVSLNGFATGLDRIRALLKN